MSAKDISREVLGGISVVVVIVAVVMIAGMPFASAISTELLAAGAAAAGFLSLYFFLWMLGKIGTAVGG